MNLLLDADGNLDYNITGLNYASGDTAFLQDLGCRLRLLPGEYMLNTAEGINLLDMTDYEAAITSELAKDGRVAYVDTQRSHRDHGCLNLDVYVKEKD